MGDITAIVNVYKRPENLKIQIDAILAQSIPPKSIYIWNNGNREIDLSTFSSDLITVFDVSKNMGVWSRFLIGLMGSTEYICVFDDDTIPGKLWFENCMTQMSKQEALYGTIGVLVKNTQRLEFLKRYGWDGPCFESMPVDFVGHSWFFKRKWLSYFIEDGINIHTWLNAGEDMYFSLVLQKHGILTLVPPHPKNMLEMYGSDPNLGYKLGCDGKSETGLHDNIYKMYEEHMKAGFRRLIDRQTATSQGDFDYFIQKIKKHTPFALIRPADGEYKVLQDNTLTNCDNWTFRSGGKLHKDLMEAVFKAKRNCCYVGIPCMECNKEMCNWYIDFFKLNPLYTTFANVFVNANWKKWVNFLKESAFPFVYIGPGDKKTHFNVIKHYAIHKNLVDVYDLAGEEYVDFILSIVKETKGVLYLFAGGPISKIIIAKAWEKHPFNTYLDIGSSLDLYFKGETTRLYHNEGCELSNLVCHFDGHAIKI
jgi:hypothetical protein